jgi:septal ring factor EnvC (AmiA/AmiB activator)
MGRKHFVFGGSKKNITLIIVYLLSLWCLKSGLAQESELEKYRSELTKKEEEILDLEKKLREAEKRKEDIKRSTRKLKIQLRKAQRERRRLKWKIQGIRREIRDVQRNISERMDMVRRLKGLLEGLILVHNMTSAVYGDHGGLFCDRSNASLVEFLPFAICENATAIKAAERKLRIELDKKREKEKNLGKIQKQKLCEDRLHRKIARKKRRETRLLWKTCKEEEFYKKKIAELKRASLQLKALISALQSGKDGTFYKADFSKLKGVLPWPVKKEKILQGFGLTVHPKFNTTYLNKGIDIQTAEGEVVRSVCPGVVVYAGYFEGYENLVMIDHGGGYYTIYGHLESLDVKKRDGVGMETAIGQVGVADIFGIPCLHFEIRHNEDSLDPLKWLK